MKAITLRGIDEETYTAVKQVSQTFHTSMNKFIINLIKDKFALKAKQEKKEFNRFLGSWTLKEYQSFLHQAGSLRKIDRELWT